MNFLSNLLINFRQLISAVLQRVTNANQATEITTRAQIGYNDTVEKIVYHDGTAVQIVASEAHVATEIASKALTVAPASASYLSIQAGQIEVKPLLVTRPIIDLVSTSLASALAARTPVYNLANVGDNSADLQAGDFLILPAHTGGLRVFLHNGGAAGGVGDFTLVEQPLLDTATIRALLSGINGLTYNPTTGEFKLGGQLQDPLTTIDLANNNTVYEVKSVGVFFRLTRGTSSRRIEIGNNLGTAIFIGDNTSELQIQSGSTWTVSDANATPRGLQYAANYAATFTARSLVDKAYVDGVNVKRSTQTVTTVADTWLTVTHNFALADKDSVVAALSLNGVQVMAEVEFMTANTLRIKTSTAVVGLKVFMLA